MNMTDQCRARAAECRSFAAVVGTCEGRAAYEEIARHWEQLAERFERHEQRNGQHAPQSEAQVSG